MNEKRQNKINENLTLTEKASSLTFGTDAYLLSAFLPFKKNALGCELGTGSGVISLLALTKEKCARMVGVEVQEEIAKIAVENAKSNNLETRFSVLCKDLRTLQSDDFEKPLDFVCANPPYMTLDSGKGNDNENKNASRHEVFGTIDDFCACASRILKHGGHFYVVYRPDRLTDLLCAMRAHRIEPKVLFFVYPRKESAPSLILCDGMAYGKSGLTVKKPIIIYENNEETLAFRNIYKTCSLEGDVNE